MAKKLQLKDLRVKSFRTVIEKAEQKTAKGGRVLTKQQKATENDNATNAIGTWTEIKSGKVVTLRLANTERID